MEKIDKVILKLETELNRTKAEVNELVDKISRFNFESGSKTAHSIKQKFCKFQFHSLVL